MYFISMHRLYTVIRSLLLLAGLVLLSHTAYAAREPVTPEEIYQSGLSQMKKGNYPKAIELFERIKTRYPSSQYAPLADLAIADTYFKQGEYVEAIDAYQTFIKLHPKHNKLDYVIYRIAHSEFKQAPRFPERDQAATRRMLATIQTFEQRFPASEHTQDVQEMREAGRERLANSTFMVGRFYYRRARFEVRDEERKSACGAASRRFEEVMSVYSDLVEVGAESLFYVGLCQLKVHKREDAKATLVRLENYAPHSAYSHKLKRQIRRHYERRGKPVEQQEAGDSGAAVPALLEEGQQNQDEGAGR